MKELFNKPSTYNRIEFWAATTLFVFLVFFHVSDALSTSLDSNTGNSEINVPFNYYFIATLIRYTILYTAFLFLNFVVVPRLLKKEAIVLNILSLLLTVVIVGFAFGMVNTFLRYELTSFTANQLTHDHIFLKSFLYTCYLLMVFIFYSIIKYVGLYTLTHSKDIQGRYQFITTAGLAAFVVWMVILFFLIVGDAHRAIKSMWIIIVPCGILFYWYSFYSLLPKSLPRKKPIRFYAGRTILIIAISFFPIWLLALLLSQDEDAGIVVATFNIAVQLLFTAPLSWILFKRQIKGNEEIYALKTELGRSNANFDFLRSQINPHFLFNALNTIYGTAIQEKAERTSEGIQRLGDMMRFMLQENMQDKIALSREIDYLNNYIILQRLRTDPNPIVTIDAAIEQQVYPIQIAPMLLIPFVENAFKHGISLREPSHIKISLEVKNNTLYFDVYNTKHEKPENDPEKNKSGIGLNNVKQRLQLLYPGKHELIIRDMKKDFFVHLTIHLA